jgi:hypothetical protein
MAEVKPITTHDVEEDMTPVPTQAQIDRLKGETEEAKKKRDADTAKKREADTKNVPEEDLIPTPTQEENDEYKAKLYHVEVSKDVPAGRQAPPEELQPTPTQFENDLFKTAAMNGGKLPEGGGDPQKAKDKEVKNKQAEANKPPVGYATRAVEHKADSN